MNGSFVLTQGAGQKLEFAVNRKGGSAKDVDWLSTGDNFEVVRRLASGEYVLTKVAKAVEVALLSIVGSTTIVATTQEFAAREKFVINRKALAKVRITELDKGFKAWFLGKVEQPIVGNGVCIYRLNKNSLDTSVIMLLGGEAKAETTLVEMFTLMEKQGSGQTGDLLTNSYANIFYIRDVDGVLRAVSCNWAVDGWYVEAYPLGNQYGWNTGRQVFSRNSLTLDTLTA